MKILEDILKSSNKETRNILINEFQTKIWNGEDYTSDEQINSILSELAYDLDFYEPNEEWRKEDPSFYGDERLEEEIRGALQKIEAYRRSQGK